jgi:hypothetical protein
LKNDEKCPICNFGVKTYKILKYDLQGKLN